MLALVKIEDQKKEVEGFGSFLPQAQINPNDILEDI